MALAELFLALELLGDLAQQDGTKSPDTPKVNVGIARKVTFVDDTQVRPRDRVGL